MPTTGGTLADLRWERDRRDRRPDRNLTALEMPCTFGIVDEESAPTQKSGSGDHAEGVILRPAHTFRS